MPWASLGSGLGSINTYENPQAGMIAQANASAWAAQQSRQTEADRLAEQKRQFDVMNEQAVEREKWAKDWWGQQQTAWDQAAADAKADRDTMLGNINTWASNWSDDWINSSISREKSYWDAKTQQTMQQVSQQFASAGRVASPYLMGEIQRRLVAQASDALQVRRFDLEQQKRTAQLSALNLQNNVYSNTQRTMIDPAQAMQIMSQLGAGSSTVDAATV